MQNFRLKFPQFKNFSNRNIIDYCMLLHDPLIQMSFSVFVRDLLCMYKEESEGTAVVEKPPVVTRAGRTIVKPIKLNL